MIKEDYHSLCGELNSRGLVFEASYCVEFSSSRRQYSKYSLLASFELATELGIEQVLEQKPAEVSGGQAERACVARAMFMNPKIILADEPTNNLDPENAKNVIELLKEIWQDTGATVIVASHDPMVERYATEIVSVKEGRVTTSGQTDEA